MKKVNYLIIFLTSIMICSCSKCQKLNLYKASIKGDEKKVNNILDKHPEYSKWKGFALSPLHQSSRSGHKDIVMNLLKNGADVNLQCKEYGRTALHYAVIEGHKDIVLLLFSHGANLNIKDDLDFTPIVYAAKTGNRELVELFISKGAETNYCVENEKKECYKIGLSADYTVFEVYEE